MKNDDKKRNDTKRAFTLVEVLIVVAILGILAAIVFPEYQNHVQQAKEAAAKDNLRILRNAIGQYAAQHNDIPPGYPLDDTSREPYFMIMGRQLTEFNDYLPSVPSNPFNGSWQIKVLLDDTEFPESPVQTDLYGWIYQPQIRVIRLNWEGTDTHNVTYFEY